MHLFTLACASLNVHIYIHTHRDPCMDKTWIVNISKGIILWAHVLVCCSVFLTMLFQMLLFSVI